VRIKQKERELKERIKVAKSSINGPSLLDRFFPKGSTAVRNKGFSYDEVFTEPVREKPALVPLKYNPAEKTVVNKEVKKKAPVKRRRKRKAAATKKDSQGFIYPDMDKQFEQLDDDLKGLGI